MTSLIFIGLFAFLGLLVLAIPVVVIVAIVGGWRTGKATGDVLLHQQNQYRKSQGH
jgi:hypothetical protein